MEIRRQVDMEKLKKFYPVLRREDNKKAKKKISKAKVAKLAPETPRRNRTKIEQVQNQNQTLKEKNIPVPKAPKIKTQAQKAKALEAKNEKKQERIEKLDGKLLTQLQMIQQRMETMDKDNERYALVENTFEDESYCFTIILIGETTKINIRVNSQFDTTCSCMDWRIRCRQLAIPCKHIYYFLKKILTYELFDYFDNRIMLPDLFKNLVNTRLDKTKDFKIKEGDCYDDEDCPICFNNFKNQPNKDQIVRCPDCKYFVHKICMQTWLSNSLRRNCVMCRSESWNMHFNN
jgi:hypothetical protein